jgi:predicted acetyltransferase
MKLVSPSPAYFSSFSDSLIEWGSTHQDGAGIRDRDSLAHRDGFDLWVAQLLAEETSPAAPGLVTCTYLWMVEDDTYLGSIALRHELNDFLAAFGGHIGYGVRPSARGRGLATQALAEVIPVAHDRGIAEVLVLCDEENLASRRTIEANGGRFEKSVEHDGRVLQRFWIATKRG